MIYSLWFAIIFVIACFAWFSRNRGIAAFIFFMIAFPLYIGLEQVKAIPVDCPVDKARTIMGYQITEEKIYILLGDKTPIFCVMDYSPEEAENLTQELVLGPNGEMGRLVMGQGEGGEPSVDLDYPEMEYTK